MVIEPRPPMSESSTKTSKFIEVPRLGTRNLTNNERSFKNFYIPIYKVLEQPWKHFTSLKL